MQRAASSHSEAGRESVVATFPPPDETSNPYQRLLYEALADRGIRLAPAARLRSQWLWERRRVIGLLHFHWLSQYYHHAGAVPRAARLLLLGQRLLLARMLGYRIVWTVHEVQPHDRTGWADTIASRIVGRLANVLIVHDESTRQKVADQLGRDPIVIPHASLGGVYAPARHSRSEVRRELGLGDETVLILCFGLIRRYKRIGDLVSALALMPCDATPDFMVLVAGQVLDSDVGDALRAAAAEDPRLKLRLDFVPDDEVRGLFDAADAALLTRADDGTSGVLALGLSLGVPLILADTPGYRAAATGARSWRFEPESPASLAEAVTRAVTELDGSPRRAVPLPSWADVAELTAAAFRSAA